MMNRDEVKKILAILNTVWPPSGVDAVALDAWALALQGQDPGLMQKAAAEWVQTEKWMPRPVELIGIANDIADAEIRSGNRALPQRVETKPLHERINTTLRLIATMDKMKIHNKHIHRSVMALNAEAQSMDARGITIGALPEWLQSNIAEYGDRVAE